MSNENKGPKLATFWKIHMFVWNSEISIQKETTFWTKSGEKWKRIGQLIEDLDFDCVLPTNDSIVSVEQTRCPHKIQQIRFSNGGYIQGTDPGWLSSITKWHQNEPNKLSDHGFDLPKGDRSRPSMLDPLIKPLNQFIDKSFFDPQNQPNSDGHVPSRSMHIEIELQHSSPLSDTPRTVPLLYYDQGTSQETFENDFVLVSDKIIGETEHAAQLTISGKPAYISDPFHVDPPHKYALSVSLDRDATDSASKKPYFEFHIDAAGISTPKEDGNEGVHWFCTNEHTFYIGYDPKSETTFDGAIRRIIFDPSVSCTTC